MTPGKDASRIRKGGAPRVMAALRNSVIHVLGGVLAPGLAAAMRTMGNSLSQALSILGLPELK